MGSDYSLGTIERGLTISAKGCKVHDGGGAEKEREALMIP